MNEGEAKLILNTILESDNPKKELVKAFREYHLKELERMNQEIEEIQKAFEDFTGNPEAVVTTEVTNLFGLPVETYLYEYKDDDPKLKKEFFSKWNKILENLKKTQ